LIGRSTAPTTLIELANETIPTDWKQTIMTTPAEQHFDLFVVGGGINGSAIACDAAGRNLSVGLAEMQDFAEGASSRSSKLIHGGLRYLETYDFRHVRDALIER
jgi:glycerol-3-phosphate dehydrogenase